MNKITSIVNHKDAVIKIMSFFDKFNSQKKKALFIYGPTGVGKSYVVKTIAEELGFEINEVSSDNFSYESLSSSIKTSSLFAKNKVIIIDELELLKSSEISKLSKLIKETKIPIVLITLDYWNPLFRILRLQCTPVEFRKLNWLSIKKYLIELSEKRNIVVDPKVIEFIAKNSSGDLRSAIIDFNLISTGKKEIKIEDILVLNRRYKEENVFEAMKKIFQFKDVSEPLKATDSITMEDNLFFMWVAENITKAFNTREEISEAYDTISLADIFYGRVKRKQNWDLYRIVKILYTAGVAFARKTPYKNFIRYSNPEKLKKLSENKNKKKLTKELTKKLAKFFHISGKYIQRDYLPLLSRIAKKHPNFLDKYQLTKEELELISSF